MKYDFLPGLTFVWNLIGHFWSHDACITFSEAAFQSEYFNMCRLSVPLIIIHYLYKFWHYFRRHEIINYLTFLGREILAMKKKVAEASLLFADQTEVGHFFFATGSHLGNFYSKCVESKSFSILPRPLYYCDSQVVRLAQLIAFLNPQNSKVTGAIICSKFDTWFLFLFCKPEWSPAHVLKLPRSQYAKWQGFIPLVVWSSLLVLINNTKIKLH